MKINIYKIVKVNVFKTDYKRAECYYFEHMLSSNTLLLSNNFKCLRVFYLNNLII